MSAALLFLSSIPRTSTARTYGRREDHALDELANACRGIGSGLVPSQHGKHQENTSHILSSCAFWSPVPGWPG